MKKFAVMILCVWSSLAQAQQIVEVEPKVCISVTAALKTTYSKKVIYDSKFYLLNSKNQYVSIPSCMTPLTKVNGELVQSMVKFSIYEKEHLENLIDDENKRTQNEAEKLKQKVLSTNLL